MILVRLAAIAALTAVAIPGAATAQIEYGPWTKVNGSCKPATMPTGPGRGLVPLPSAGGSGATECKWTRDVKDCPRLRDKLRHPIQCTTRKQTSGASIQPPAN